MASSAWFDFWLPDGSLGGFCGLGSEGFLAGLAGEGRPYLLVKDADVRHVGLEVRAEGLWAAFNHESEGHWSWGLEAFGVAFDDPEDAVRTEWGDRAALGFDLEWEAPDLVHGEILVGPSERIDFNGVGRFAESLPLDDAAAAGAGLAAPVRLRDGVVLRQWLTPGGWVRRRDGSAGGTA